MSNDSLIFIVMLGGGLEGMSAAVQMQLNLEREEVMCQPWNTKNMVMGCQLPPIIINGCGGRWFGYVGYSHLSVVANLG